MSVAVLPRLPDEAFVLPREITPAIHAVLRVSPIAVGEIASALDRAGRLTIREGDDGRAHVLHFLLPYAIAYGDDWWPRAHEHLVQALALAGQDLP